MYTLTSEKIFGKDKLKLSNPASGEYLSIIPSLGGNLHELVLLKNGTLHSIIDGDINEDGVAGKITNHYKGSKLSPFPNRIANGEYDFNGLTYKLELNSPPNAIHGLCWKMPFTLKSELMQADSASVVLEAEYKARHTGYPFSYRIEMEYILTENDLKCITRVTNTSIYIFPIGDGWHPYFTTGSKVDTLQLQLPEHKHMELDKLLPTGKYLSDKLFTTLTPIKDSKLDDCFELNETDQIVETRLVDKQKNISIVVWQQTGEPGYNFIQVYTPADRNSIAIEPMSCAPDGFNNRKGLVILSPKQTVEFCFWVNLE